MSLGPPSGPPSGPSSGPPMGPPHGPPTGPSQGPPTGPPKWLVPGIGILVVIVIIAGIASCGGDKKSTSQGGGEIFLEPIADVGTDPFTKSTAKKPPKTTVPPDTPVTITKTPPL